MIFPGHSKPLSGGLGHLLSRTSSSAAQSSNYPLRVMVRMPDKFLLYVGGSIEAMTPSLGMTLLR